MFKTQIITYFIFCYKSLFMVLGRLITLITKKFPLSSAGIIWIVKLYCVIVLFIRSFFSQDSAMFIIVPSLFLLLIKLAFPGLITFTLYIGFWLYFGVTLITYDAIGSLISSHIFKNPDHWLSTYVTVNLAKSTNVFKRYVGFHAMGAIILGKTNMTSTGRAALVVGITSGIGFAINEVMNRHHATSENALQRAHDSVQQDKQLAHDSVQQDKQLAHNANEKALDRAQVDKQLAQDEKTLEFKQRKYSAAQLANAKNSWWSK